MDLDWNDKTGLTIPIQNLILTLDCNLRFNPPNWITIRIEQSSNPIQQSNPAILPCSRRDQNALIRPETCTLNFEPLQINFSEKYRRIRKSVSQICTAKLGYVGLDWFRLKPIFTNVPAASKNDVWFKSGQKWHKNNYLALFI